MSDGTVTGTILKGVGGLYTVYSGGRTLDCRLRGSIRLDGRTPVTGDSVTLSFTGRDGEAVIDALGPRRNQLIRPKVANVDNMVLVIASASPAPDLFLVDKLLIAARVAGIRPVLVINKADQDAGAAARIAAQYAGAATCLITRAADKDAHGLAPLLSELDGATSVLAGQSGVGKSTILNLLTGGAFMSTGAISEKTQRGRHTTRHAELFPVAAGLVKAPSFVIDSPGFSLLELADIAPRELAECYPEIYEHAGVCRFQDCSHTGEPDCFLTELVAGGAFPKERYERYKQLYRELESREKNKYQKGKTP
ncbi:MAG: ribosome small subunit-dependent GTPase A [Clostridia bacterium]|nr:ribosome small subunit-dependent GTPase A [Clostridia bacterium]